MIHKPQRLQTHENQCEEHLKKSTLFGLLILLAHNEKQNLCAITTVLINVIESAMAMWSATFDACECECSDNDFISSRLFISRYAIACSPCLLPYLLCRSLSPYLTPDVSLFRSFSLPRSLHLPRALLTARALYLILSLLVVCVSWLLYS